MARYTARLAEAVASQRGPSTPGTHRFLIVSRIIRNCPNPLISSHLIFSNRVNPPAGTPRFLIVKRTIRNDIKSFLINKSSISNRHKPPAWRAAAASSRRRVPCIYNRYVCRLEIPLTPVLSITTRFLIGSSQRPNHSLRQQQDRTGREPHMPREGTVAKTLPLLLEDLSLQMVLR